jgi:hypothetical protein
MGTVTRVVTPESAFMVTPMGTQDVPSSQRASIADDLKTELVAVLKNIGNPKYTFTAGGTEQVGGVAAQLLEIGADGATVKWYVDPASGKVLRAVSHAGGPTPGESVTDYSDWKSFDGLQLPAAAAVTRGGERASELHLGTVELNPAIEADAFAKPSGS